MFFTFNPVYTQYSLQLTLRGKEQEKNVDFPRDSIFSAHEENIEQAIKSLHGDGLMLAMNLSFKSVNNSFSFDEDFDNTVQAQAVMSWARNIIESKLSTNPEMAINLSD